MDNTELKYDEAMKTFIPEYYQYIGEIDSYKSSFIKGKTYKIINKNDLEASFNFIDEKGTPNGYEGVNWKKFKPSTKEAYDAQFVVKEPLPQFKVIESIETITKVENNEGNQFFIGDIVISDSGFVQTIKSFRYNVNKDNVLATTNICNQISIARLEHYIEPKVEVEETLLEKAKRLYPIGTKFNNYKIAKGVDRTVEVLTTNIIEEFGKIKLLNPEKRRNNNAGTWTLYKDGEFAEIIK